MKKVLFIILALAILAFGDFCFYKAGYDKGVAWTSANTYSIPTVEYRYVLCHNGVCEVLDPKCVDPEVRKQFEGK
jgi:hypothetical protein